MKRFAVTAAACAAAAGAVLAGGAPASADTPKKPYPDISRYTKLDFEGFQIDGKPGVWFSSPNGLNCGIWEDGSFGCTGSIPGAPAGTNQIGWFTGDTEPHYDSTAQLRFVAGGPQRVLPPNSFIKYGSTTCATTPANGVYCDGSYYAQFLVNPDASWLGNPGY